MVIMSNSPDLAHPLESSHQPGKDIICSGLSQLQASCLVSIEGRINNLIEAVDDGTRDHGS